MTMKMFCSVLHSGINDNKSCRVQQAEESKETNCSVEVYWPEIMVKCSQTVYTEYFSQECECY